MAKNLVKKTQVAPFISKTAQGTTPDWIRIKKSTAFTLSLNPNTQEFDFISSDVPESEIDYYKPSLSQEITMFKGEEDYQLFFDMLFGLPTGADAHRDVLIVFYQERCKWSGVEVYKAWKVDALVQINQMDTVNENITVDLAFAEPEQGIVQIVSKKPAFTAGTFSGEEFTADDGSAPTVVKHSVTFDANGGTGDDPVIADVAEGSTFTLPANPYTKDGCTFKGWEVGGATKAVGDAVTMGTADITVKALWESA